jgi:hypothetical protein
MLMAGGCFAQSEPAKAGAAQPAEKKFYHLDLVVKEVESGKTVNARAYSMNVAENERTSTRTGSRLPVPSGGPTVAGKTQFTFVDVGTNIDCSNAREVTQNQLALYVSVDISSVLNVSVGTEPDASAPVVRQVKWSSPVIVQLRKPTTVFSSDDPTSKRQMQLEITASPIK